jgi:hypothetical protein
MIVKVSMKAFMIVAGMQLRVCFSTSFHDREGFATLSGIGSFAIMEGDAGGAGGLYGWDWRDWRDKWG